MVISGFDAVSRYSAAAFAGLVGIAYRLHRVHLPALGLLLFLKTPSCGTAQTLLGLVALSIRVQLQR